MLAHHAAEALLRHFFAHLDANPLAPVWLVMSVRDRAFRRRVREVRDSMTGELVERVRWAFLGDADRAAQDAGQEAVNARVVHVAHWLRQAADLHLHAGNGYNAAKHGLSALPAYRHVSFVESEPGTGAPIGRPVDLFAGAALLSLESEGSGEERRWFQVARLVDSPGLVAMTLVFTDLLDAVWQVGRARQIQQVAAVSLVATPSFGDLIAGHTKEWGQLKTPLVQPSPLSDPAADAVLRHLAKYNSDDEEGDATETAGVTGPD